MCLCLCVSVCLCACASPCMITISAVHVHQRAASEAFPSSETITHRHTHTHTYTHIHTHTHTYTLRRAHTHLAVIVLRVCPRGRALSRRAKGRGTDCGTGAHIGRHLRLQNGPPEVGVCMCTPTCGFLGATICTHTRAHTHTHTHTRTLTPIRAYFLTPSAAGRGHRRGCTWTASTLAASRSKSPSIRRCRSRSSHNRCCLTAA